MVWAQESICRAEDKETFLLEAARLLKPGGRIVVGDRFRSARLLDAEEEALLERRLSGWAVPDLPSAGEFARAAVRAGPLDVRVEDATAEAWPSLACAREGARRLPSGAGAPEPRAVYRSPSGGGQGRVGAVRGAGSGSVGVRGLYRYQGR